MGCDINSQAKPLYFYGARIFLTLEELNHLPAHSNITNGSLNTTSVHPWVQSQEKPWNTLGVVPKPKTKNPVFKKQYSFEKLCFLFLFVGEEGVRSHSVAVILRSLQWCSQQFWGWQGVRTICNVRTCIKERDSPVPGSFAISNNLLINVIRNPKANKMFKGILSYQLDHTCKVGKQQKLKFQNKNNQTVNLFTLDISFSPSRTREVL